ncbi:SOS response-associated peptidase [Caldithrix abyssi]|nr:SOS response-associated peptidase [Caldithrix abyssi]
MCGRKTLTRDMQSIIEEMAIEEWQDSDLYTPSFNIAPTQSLPILIDHMGRRVKSMQWGLIPSWAKDESIGSKLINARAETLLQKPSFQNLVPRKRCVVITDGYYEWKRTLGKSIPYYIHHPDNMLLSMAGLWDTWKNHSGESIFSYTVITTTPAPYVEDIHHRMPVILKTNEIDAWLQVHHTSIPNAMSMLKPYPDKLQAFQVSTMVNSPKNNCKECIIPVCESDSLSLF